MLEMITVNTSTIEAIGYEPGSKRLHVNFISTEDTYLAEEIKDKYRHTEIY